jgi:hypothetical protein
VTEEARPLVAQPYLRILEELIAGEHANSTALACRHFFGGAALYSNSAICASLTPVGIAFKLPEQRCAELIASGTALPLRYFRDSPVKRGYVLFANVDGLGSDVIAGYLRECLEHVSRSAG